MQRFLFDPPFPSVFFPISDPRQILSYFPPNSSLSPLQGLTMTSEVQIFGDNKHGRVRFTHLLGLPQLFGQWLGDGQHVLFFQQALAQARERDPWRESGEEASLH